MSGQTSTSEGAEVQEPNRDVNHGRPDQWDAWKLLGGDHTNYRDLENGGANYAFNEEEHGKALLQNICMLWEKEQLIDVRMVSEDRKKFAYHGVLLAACSCIFRKILASEQVQVYQGFLAPRGVNADVLENLTNCLYKPETFSQIMQGETRIREFARYFELIEELVVNSVIDTSKLLKNLNEMFMRRCMTFTILKVAGRDIPCHGLVMAVASPKLRNDMLSLYACEELLNCRVLPYEPVNMEGHTSEVVEALVNFIYTAKLEVLPGTAAEMLYSSCKLGIPSAIKATCHFILRNLVPENALSWRNTAQKAEAIHNDKECQELGNKAEEFIVENYQRVMVTEEFQNIATYSDILKFTVKAKLDNVEKKDILKALMQWYEHNKEERLELLPQLFTIINIIKDSDGFTKVMAEALQESGKEIFGVIAGAALFKEFIAAQGQTERNHEGSEEVQPRFNTDQSNHGGVTA